jgi:hypothetical protein
MTPAAASSDTANSDARIVKADDLLVVRAMALQHQNQN